jgi:hypothetical protein
VRQPWACLANEGETQTDQDARPGNIGDRGEVEVGTGRADQGPGDLLGDDPGGMWGLLAQGGRPSKPLKAQKTFISPTPPTASAGPWSSNGLALRARWR